MPTDTEYDTLAWFYDRYWGPRFHDAARPALERLVYASLAPGDLIVELCCGSGHLTQELLARGYRVIGIDRSLEMLRHARRRAPGASVICGDIARTPLAGTNAHAAVSTFDSINHLLSEDAIVGAFRGAASALRPGGVFVFDINTEEAYRSEWGKSSAITECDAALFVRGAYDAAALIGRTSITMFRLAETAAWQRADVEVAQRCYAPEQLAAALRGAGFRDVQVIPADAAGMTGDIGVGRVFLSARRGDE